ncbi:hypothetical protein ACRRTK_008418 [Alexandromys fortis]
MVGGQAPRDDQGLASRLRALPGWFHTAVGLYRMRLAFHRCLGPGLTHMPLGPCVW